LAKRFTCAGKSITSVTNITGAIKTVRYIAAGCKLTASSVIVSTFIHICVKTRPGNSRLHNLPENNGLNYT